MNTIIYRKCKSCYYFSRDGWCLWLGQPRKPYQYECDDGYCNKNDYGKKDCFFN